LQKQNNLSLSSDESVGGTENNIMQDTTETFKISGWNKRKRRKQVIGESIEIKDEDDDQEKKGN